MKATSRDTAWEMVREIFQSEYHMDKDSSYRAGYPIYRSTTEYYDYICDLGTRFEINLKDGNRSINVWYEEPAETSEAVGAEQNNMMERRETAKRVQRLTYCYTVEYVKELDNRKREQAAQAEMMASAGDGQIKCMVLTAENNAKIMMDCITDCIHAVNLLTNAEEDVEDWMLAGINAILDKIYEGKIIPFDLPISICGLLCAQYR